MNADCCPVVWRRVPFAARYEVSNYGDVRSYVVAARSLRRREVPRLLAGEVNGGYPRVQWYGDNGRRQTSTVHVLVALTFLGPRPDGQQVRHLDGDKRNNHVCNLAYGTPSENQLDEVRLGRNHNQAKTHCPKGHPYDESNTKLVATRSGFSRNCRRCQADASARYKARKRVAA